MKGAPIIVRTATAVPAHTATQDEVKDRLRALLPLPARKLDAVMELFDHTAVERRFSVEPLSALGNPRGLGEVQRLYRENAIALGKKVAAEALAGAGVEARDIDLIVTTSCTGIMIPSLDAHLCNELGFRADVRRLPITALGCSGGAAALARAHDFLVGFPEARALVVAVELPSLSIQRADLSLANLVSTALFGDGAAAAVLEGGLRAEARPARTGVRVLETLAHLFPRSTYALGFDLQDDGFHSVLSKDVPALIKTEIARLVRTLAGRRDLPGDKLSCFVLHPGGRKILAFIEEELGLRRDDTQLSWDVLRDFGNQSSASVLFVLHEWLTKRLPAPGAHGILAAFGPGLSTEMLLLQWS
ncbi:MAG TPA: 3-oxoacyl-[acyl-carrier-protein] synthase III C-terminal domain-containing protein [Polyangia bacterium]|jgi:alkylresorcinol/alkylpyrone synthase|nr:3-oxoacyl-[acyl-carrier-protein] synthase III C-terminal domain-containing protein [Polyangia bacterium]